MTTQRCTYCGGVPNGTWCCERAELDALRAVVDQTIRDMGSGITAPLEFGESPERRDLLAVSRARLAAARRAA